MPNLLSRLRGLRPAMTRRAFWLWAALITLLRCAVTHFQLAYMWAGGAPLDDELMFRAANAITSGQWLGEYDYLTLSKSMFLPSGWHCSTNCTCPTCWAGHCCGVLQRCWRRLLCARCGAKARRARPGP